MNLACVGLSQVQGIWMGGTLPIVYDVRERTLVVNESDAKIVPYRRLRASPAPTSKKPMGNAVDSISRASEIS